MASFHPKPERRRRESLDVLGHLGTCFGLMRPHKKQITVIVFGALCLGLIVLAYRWPSRPNLIVPLADGSRFVLVGIDSGRQLCYGGGRWQRVLCKALGRELPAFVHDQPVIWPAFYTNGIGLLFCRAEPDKASLQRPWNGSGQLCFLDESNVEHWAPSHCVNFQIETRGQLTAVVGENIYWEIPMSHDPELRLRIRETNDLTGTVTVHNFRVKNPAL
jgi:hypothetical protein